MKVEIVLTASFLRDLKKLKRKHRSLPEDFEKFKQELIQDPDAGIYLRNNISKIRMAIRSKGRGKSGGARVIAYHEILLQITQHTIHLIAIYDKSDQKTISDTEIQNLLVQNGLA